MESTKRHHKHAIQGPTQRSLPQLCPTITTKSHSFLRPLIGTLAPENFGITRITPYQHIQQVIYLHWQYHQFHIEDLLKTTHFSSTVPHTNLLSHRQLLIHFCSGLMEKRNSLKAYLYFFPVASFCLFSLDLIWLFLLLPLPSSSFYQNCHSDQRRLCA